MTENVNRHPGGRGFPSEEAKKRGLIQSIEQTLDTTDQLTLNNVSLNTFANQVNGVVNWMRGNNGNYQQGKESVLHNLRQARIQLQTACSEFEKKGRTRTFLSEVERGRAFLERALMAW